MLHIIMVVTVPNMLLLLLLMMMMWLLLLLTLSKLLHSHQSGQLASQRIGLVRLSLQLLSQILNALSGTRVDELQCMEPMRGMAIVRLVLLSQLSEAETETRKTVVRQNSSNLHKDKTHHNIMFPKNKQFLMTTIGPQPSTCFCSAAAASAATC
jgi:biopolymer transport protein ExbB/TolQ